MHLTFGIRLNPEDQIAGIDKIGHGESWHGPTPARHPSARTNKVLPGTTAAVEEGTAGQSSAEPPKQPAFMGALQNAFV